jgi:hypothetical protein
VLWTGLIWIKVGTPWRPLVNAVMSLRVPLNTGEFLSSRATGAFSQKTQFHGISYKLLGLILFFVSFFVVCLQRYLPAYGCTALVDIGRFFSFLIYTQSVGLLGRGISRSQGFYLHTEQHNHRINAHRHLSSGIRSHDPSVRADEDGSCLSPRGHCDRLFTKLVSKITSL